MNIADWYSIAKALHLIGMVSWMAGVFYLVRIMVNHAMALEQPEPVRGVLAPQFSQMSWKAYRIIIRPAVVITWSFGVMMLCIQTAWLRQGWMHVKLLLLVLFSVYTHACQHHIRLLEHGSTRYNHVYYRALNEVPTLFLVSIVFLAVFKDRINWIYLAVGVGLFAGLIFNAVRRLNSKTPKI
jgi:protoporphyrinogen IX oxidase